MHNQKEVILYKPQGSDNFVYEDVPSYALTATDLAEVLKGSTMEPDIQVEPIEIVAGGFDQYPAVPGKEPAKGNLKFPMNPASGATGQVLPQWGKVLYGSCDFALVQTVAGTVPGNFVFTPLSNATNAGVIWHYTGDAASSAALLSKFYNCKGAWKITMPANKVPIIEITMTGAFHGETDATQPAATDLAAAKARENPYALKGAVISVFGNVSYRVLSFDFEGGEQIANRDDISESNGCGKTDTTDRKIKFSIKCYAEAKATIDPLASLKASTEAAISVAFGLSTKKITISGTYAQITSRTRAEENGITTFDIKGQFNRNNFSIRIN
jgi:hypothetical protein